MQFAVISRPYTQPHRANYRIAKRVLDLFIVLLALPIALPLMALCALAIRLNSPGPALFIQERVGKGGHRFKLYKFRTMPHKMDNTDHKAFMRAFVLGQVSGNGSGNTIFKPFDNSQITRVGRILRRFSLDEIPQLLNVLKGEMSLVGPRPNVPWEVNVYKGWHLERLEVLPGITGLAQITGRSGISFDTIVKYDLEYIKHQSLWTDLEILARTLLSVILARGAH